MNCSLHKCDRQAKVRTYCKIHFLEQFVRPLEKELANSKLIVQRLENDIKMLKDELTWAEPTADEIIPYRPQVNNRICPKCDRKFVFSSETFLHAINCSGKRAKVNKGGALCAGSGKAVASRQPAVKDVIVNETVGELESLI